ncbi:MAG: 50S ribosomal protein L10 [Candidatus Komeilibacteria bacterium CG10_big_fil_rev_8_21_14_0_10_41_13]|uniref:Large ribosomal subunit protein uL10 n=1 Tax=Candidatus Komeilibacteria bacterium CG10_big_fil_rev_8_21_14_0_10_41_13 TaxID=1974476 RepID=A0A2M6WCM2_9BACT|nr:MAG: 50S ribosomal protein L10 [Candidatus Komeilibacteria bacterium CG10_big_fil_rev_8_21_14_0_10_41_13]
MPKTQQQKQVEVEKLKDNLASAKSVVLASYQGLSVAKSQQLRNDLRKEGARFMASKKTLLKKALSDSGLEANLDQMSGNIGLAFGEDEVTPAKIMAEFAKNEEEAMTIHGGFLEKSFIDSAKVLSLAKLPSKLELIAKTVGTIKAPISGFVNVLSGNLRGLVNVLNAVKETKIN